jgi:hypothetical protein
MRREKPTLPLEQVAAFMACSPEQAMEMALERRLPFERGPEGVRVHPEDLAAYLAAAGHAAENSAPGSKKSRSSKGRDSQAAENPAPAPGASR